MLREGDQTLIALGSNEKSVWGDARETIQKAMLLVAKLSRDVPLMSGFFVTKAFPAGSGPDYVNAAIAIKTDLKPPALLAALHEIEAEAGRKRARRWGQRTLDLDLIAMGDCVLPDATTHREWRDLSLADQQRLTPDDLILPHPRLQDRAFVLMPLLDIAPDWHHPLLQRSIAQLCADLPGDLRAEVTRLSDPAPL
ncbi:MAG: 2-amino-4-hydroxy-6-hydroxymethyldihydropteridine diphosphokinase [Pseudomonadota bacterium]